MTYTLHCGNCLDVLPTIASASVDAVITDPPYPEISRDYGRMTEDEWWEMMMGVCTEVRRVLKPTGSAVFILQPNSRKVGSMRGWLWEFMAWVCRDWNMVQDAYWWNYTAITNGLCSPRERGLLRTSVKPCVWAGDNPYRNQDAVLWSMSDATIADRTSRRFLRVDRPSGNGSNPKQAAETAYQRGGTTPFNLFPVAHSYEERMSKRGHGASTPLALADWWTRYIVPTGGVVLDPFNGAGTMGVAALQNGASYIGIEQMQKYVDVTHERLAKVQPALVGVAA